MKKARKFNLIQLESDLDVSYQSWVLANNEETRTNLFLSIEKLAFAIISVKINKNAKDLAYEYALYLFERLILKIFVPVYRDKMPWQSYIDLNLRHIVFSKEKDPWMELISDFEYLMNNEESIYDFNVDDRNEVNNIISDLSYELRDYLLMFYTKTDISRMLPISMEFLFSSNQIPLGEGAPKDIKDFLTVLVCLSKRVVSTNSVSKSIRISKKEYSKAFGSSIKSTIFLASVVNSDFFPKELLLSLDIDSLHRLILLLGGEKIRIPTQKELNTLIGSVVAVSKMVEGDKDVKKVLNKSKRDLGLVFSHQVNIQNFISKVIGMSAVSNGRSEDVIINVAFDVMKSVNEVLGGFIDKICSNYSSESVDSFKPLLSSINEHMECVSKIKLFLESVIDKEILSLARSNNE